MASRGKNKKNKNQKEITLICRWLGCRWIRGVWCLCHIYMSFDKSLALLRPHQHLAVVLGVAGESSVVVVPDVSHHHQPFPLGHAVLE